MVCMALCILSQCAVVTVITYLTNYNDSIVLISPTLMCLTCFCFVVVVVVFGLFCRIAFRDKVGSLPVLVNALDAAMFPSTPTDVHKSDGLVSGQVQTTAHTDVKHPAEPAVATSSSSEECAAVTGEGVAAPAGAEGIVEGDGAMSTAPSLFPARDMCFVLPEPLTDEKCVVVSEILKIIFNQTVSWKEEQDIQNVSKWEGE